MSHRRDPHAEDPHAAWPNPLGVLLAAMAPYLGVVGFWCGHPGQWRRGAFLPWALPMLPQGWAKLAAVACLVLLAGATVEIRAFGTRGRHHWRYYLALAAGMAALWGTMGAQSAFGAFSEEIHAAFLMFVVAALALAALGVAFLADREGPAAFERAGSTLPPRPSPTRRGRNWLFVLIVPALALKGAFEAWDHLGVERSFLLPSGLGLIPGTRVVYKGMTVGYVEHARLAPDEPGIDVQVILDAKQRCCGPMLTPRRDADLLSLSRHITLLPSAACSAPGTLASVIIDRDAALAVRPVDERLLEYLEAVPPEDVRRLVAQGEHTLVAADVALASVTRTVDEASSLLRDDVPRTLASVNGTLQRADGLVGHTETLVADLSPAAAGAKALLGPGSTLPQDLPRLAKDASRLVADGDAFLAKQSSNLDCLYGSGPRLDPLAYLQFGLTVRFGMPLDPDKRWTDATKKAKAVASEPCTPEPPHAETSLGVTDSAPHAADGGLAP